MAINNVYQTTRKTALEFLATQRPLIAPWWDCLRNIKTEGIYWHVICLYTQRLNES